MIDIFVAWIVFQLSEALYPALYAAAPVVNVKLSVNLEAISPLAPCQGFQLV